jgi:hypothetical protein
MNSLIRLNLSNNEIVNDFCILKCQFPEAGELNLCKNALILDQKQNI